MPPVVEVSQPSTPGHMRKPYITSSFSNQSTYSHSMNPSTSLGAKNKLTTTCEIEASAKDKVGTKAS